MGGIILSTVFSQFTVYLSQYLITENFTNGVKILSYLLITHALCVIFLQPFIVAYSENRSPITNIVMGTLCLSISQLLFIFTPHHFGLTGMIFTMVIFAIGEILILPNTLVIVDRIAPNQLKGAYFGAHNLTNLGFFFCPLISLFLLENYGSDIMFASLSFLCIFGMMFFIVGNKLKTFNGSFGSLYNVH